MNYYPKLNLSDDREMRDRVRESTKYISKKKLRDQGRVNALITRTRRKARKAMVAATNIAGIEDNYYVASHVPTRDALVEMGILAGFTDTVASMPVLCKVASAALLLGGAWCVYNNFK